MKTEFMLPAKTAGPPPGESIAARPGVMLRQHRDEDFFLSHEIFKRTSEVMVRRLQAARSRLSAIKKSARSADRALA